MKEKTTCYEIMLKQEEQDKEKRRLLVLLAVEKVCNAMVERYQGQIDSGELTVDDIVNIGNSYIKTLLLALVLFISGCFLNPFRGSPKEDIVLKEAPLEEVLKEEPPPDEAFPFEADTTTTIVEPPPPPPEPPPPLISTKLWPNDENFWIVVDHPKIDKTGRRVRYNIRMQWRQMCGGQDTDWYDMNYRGRVAGTDSDYLISEGKTLDAPDTVTVLASALKERDPSGTCEWQFRTRIEASENIWDWSAWGALKFNVKLVDPRSIRVLETPRIDFVN